MANENFECMNCGRTVVAEKLAPYLEKCMGKDKKMCLKSNKKCIIGIHPQQVHIKQVITNIIWDFLLFILIL